MRSSIVKKMVLKLNLENWVQLHPENWQGGGNPGTHHELGKGLGIMCHQVRP